MDVKIHRGKNSGTLNKMDLILKSDLTFYLKQGYFRATVEEDHNARRWKN